MLLPMKLLVIVFGRAKTEKMHWKKSFFECKDTQSQRGRKQKPNCNDLPYRSQTGEANVDFQQ